MSTTNIIDPDKLEAIKQWEHDPCGFCAAKEEELYTKTFYEHIDQNRYKEYAPWFKDAIGFEQYKNKKILEVGFGMGTDLFQFALGGNEIHGIDLVPAHLKIASKRFELYNIPAILQIGDAEAIPYSDNTFDVVYSFGVIHHTPNTQKAINEIYRVLKNGGEAIIGVYHKNSIFNWCAVLPRVVSAWLRGKSTRRILASIEYQENSDACPLVKMYNKKELKSMSRIFSSVDLTIDHLERPHFMRLSPFVNRWIIEKMRHHFGWYLIAKCRKK